MTFYEAALRVLEGEGRPLHFLEITEKSIAQNLLSHVGKMPEQTMLSRLAAMAKRTRDRRVIVTAKDTFALTDWSLPEDAEALAQTGLPEENEEESLPPLRPTERHPEPRSDLVRSSGRSERKRRPEEEEGRHGRRKRFPPVAEVAFEVLTEAGQALAPEALLEKARSLELASDELSASMLLTSLLEDNQRRIDAGRRPQFLYSREQGEIGLERAGSPSEAPSLELQAAFAEALGIPLEGGRPVFPSRGGRDRDRERPREGQGERQVGGGEEVATLFAAAKAAVKEARRGSAKELRTLLANVDVGTLERASVRMLHGLSFRELKVAKRSKDGPLLTARRREGSVELRYAVRIRSATAPLDRRTVQDLRRDLSNYSAQVGLLISPQDVRADARGEAQTSGSLVFLWCGDALGEKFLEAKAGVRAQSLELFEVDATFFEAARLEADEARQRREERSRDRQRDEGEEVRLPREPVAEGPVGAAPVGDEGQDDGEGEGEEGGDEDLEAARAFVSTGTGGESEAGGAPGQAGARRRRRRRRGRRGRGPKPEGAGEAGGTSAGDGSGGNHEPSAGVEAAPPPAPPPSAPSGGDSAA